MSTTRFANVGGIKTKVWELAVPTRLALLGRPTAPWRALPDFVVIGAQRSGTTSVYEYLRDHPQVQWPPLVKSPHWFDTNYHRPLSWYQSHFPLASRMGTTITGEASPYYLHHPCVAERIASHLPGVKLIAVLRDPVSRAWSHYQHERQRGYETLTFAEAIAREDERLAPELPRLAAADYVGHHHRHHSYLSRGRYDEQLARYFDHFAPGQLLVLFTAELFADPADTWTRVCNFLGIDTVTAPQVARHNARVYDRMPDDVRAQLAAAFAPHDARLAQLLGRAVPWRS